MKTKYVALLLIVAGLLAFALAPLLVVDKKKSAREPLVVYCAAGLKKPVEAVASAFEKDVGIKISLQYGGTATLLSQIKVAKQGDLFVAADDGSLEDARKMDVIREVLPVALQHPVLMVARGNPKGITGLDDLLKSGVKFALADPDAASISKVSRRLLGEKWAVLAAKAAVTKPTVMDIASDVKIGAVDAAIVWDSTVAQFKESEAVAVAELSNHAEKASAAVLSFCRRSADALSFARYLSAPDKGGAVFEQHGFKPAGGDKWAAKPDVLLYSGGVNRPAIEKLVQEFADREGITLTTVFNGCGILCAAMKAMESADSPKYPDAYYACDVCFVPPVAKQFPEAVLLTQTEIVIAVPKGNAKNVRTLADLAQPGLKLGICNAEQSTLGFMTRAILKSSNLLDSVMKNVVVQVPTADFLVNQMRAGALDAAIVYLVNVKAAREHFDVFPLPADKARAVQPFAVRKDSDYRGISNRLLAWLRGHKETFEAAGFVWTGNSEPVASDKLDIPPWLRQQQ
ncbi:MAG: substrate-binding domain-containing protein [Verrucomicrobiaceae bacterium]|nr:substrate-binding domain-containing protein [Verrucomicrobiaceae bacterium]